MEAGGWKLGGDGNGDGNGGEGRKKVEGWSLERGGGLGSMEVKGGMGDMNGARDSKKGGDRGEERERGEVSERERERVCYA